MINSFRNENFFLSNMYECDVCYEGIIFSSAEAAFQAAKCADKDEMYSFIGLNGYEAKRKGRTVKLRKDWNDKRVEIMYDIVKSKFTLNPSLRIKLLNTGDKKLIEGNTWGDTFWGVCNGVGKNYLGKILMKVRSELR